MLETADDLPRVENGCGVGEHGYPGSQEAALPLHHMTSLPLL